MSWNWTSLLGSENLAEWGWILVLTAGFLAGLINGVVGSGTLISFPLLLLLGYPPLAANVSNNLGLVPGSLAAVSQYRTTLVESRAAVLQLVPLSAAGSLVGSLLLVLLPSSVFDAIVPVLIGVALVFVLLQPLIQRHLATRKAINPAVVYPAPKPGVVPLPVLLAMPLLGAYGGYFGAAQGILLLVVLGTALNTGFGEVNGLKSLLALVANLVAGIVFVFVASDEIDWTVVGLISIGSVIGGVVGARGAKRLHPGLYRAAILVVGLLALGATLWRG
jgi:uncharacterized membrane protein YfcA